MNSNTVEPRYNEVLETMKSTLLYFSLYQGKNTKKYKLKSYMGPAKEGFVISDLFITRFHCTIGTRSSLILGLYES